MESNYEFWYENTILRIRWYTKVELAEPMTYHPDGVSVAAFFPYSPAVGATDKWYAMVCKMNINNDIKNYFTYVP